MTEQDKKQLDLEVDHIFDSGASPTRISEMVERFIDSRNLIKNHGVIGDVIDCDGCYKTGRSYLGSTCPKCNRPFRSVKP